MARSAPDPREDEEVRSLLVQLRDGSREDKIAARAGLGPIFERRGLLAEAAECYEANIRVGVRDPALYRRLAEVYRSQGRRKLAAEVLDEAEKLSRARRSALPPPSPPRPPVSREVYAPRRPRDVGPLEAQTAPMVAADSASPFLDSADADTATLVRLPERAADAVTTRPAGQRPWYAASPAIVLGLLLLGPFGLPLMWLRANWSRGTKWLVTAVWLGLSVFLAALGVRFAIDSINATAGPAGGRAATPIAAQATSPSPSPIAGQVILPASPVATASPPPAAGASPPPSAIEPAGGATPGSASASPALPRVRVVNTGGEGANLRDQPSGSANRVKNLPDGTILEVTGNDQAAEGKRWRPLRDSAGASGWIVTDYLEPVPPTGSSPTPTR